MTKMVMTIELEYDEVVMYGDDERAKNWFFHDVLADPYLILRSNFIGDEIGKVRVIETGVSHYSDENKKLRHLLFMAHGSKEHYLYGDDGERTCNTCWIDFNTDSPDVIGQKIYAYNMRKIAKLQAEGKWPPEFFKTENAKITGDTGIGEQK